MKLTEQQEQHILGNVLEALESGEPWKDDDAHYPAENIIATILTIEGMEKDEDDEDSNEGFSSNGWQYDWWQEFKHQGKKYILSGSGFDGGHEFQSNDD